MVRGAIALLVLVLVAACGDDSLKDADRPPPPPDTGRIAGRLCDAATGVWLAGVVVTLRGEDRTTTTDANGTFTFDEVLPGHYVLDFDSAALSPQDVEVVAGQTAEIGSNQCTDPRGSLVGRACDLAHGVALPDATVTLSPGGASTTAAADGAFAFPALAPGDYQVSVASGSFTDTRSATVETGSTTELGPVACGGGVEGNLCIGDYWLSGATVSITLGDATVISALTTGGGHYTIDDVPAGHHTVRGEKNSFSVTFEIDVELGMTTLVPDRCLRPDLRIAVVTGKFDHSEHVLADLGLPMRDHYQSATVVDELDAGGLVDLIHGEPVGVANSTWPDDGPSKFWLDGFLTDLTWMREYDVIFLNCGANISPFWETPAPTYATQAMSNLRQWVDEGGSLYVSDWSAPVLEHAFPGEIAARAGQEQHGVGAIVHSLNVDVADSGLSAALGGLNTLELAFDNAYWFVLSPTPSQPSSVHVLLEARIGYYTGLADPPIAIQDDTPLLVHVDYGDGRILFTSMHIEVGHTPQPALPEVLEYIVFEL